MPHERPRLNLDPIPLIVALGVLAWAVRWSDGTYAPPAVAGVAATWVILVLAALFPHAVARTGGAGAARWALAAALVAQLAINLRMPPSVPAAAAPATLPALSAALVLATASAVAATLMPRSRVRGMLLLATIGAAGFAWTFTVAGTKNIYIDVISFHQAACAALDDGRNPYATLMPDVYGAAGADFYAPGVVAGGQVRYAYPYPPLSLLATYAGWLGGDVRWGLVAAGVLTAALIAATAGGAARAGVAALFLLAPHALYVTPLGYTDGYVAAALAGVVLCARRAPRVLPVALGLLLATKQYAVIFLPAVPLLIPEPWGDRIFWRRLWRLFWPAALVAAALTLPPLLLDARSYLHALVLVQMRQPFRADSLGFLPLLSGPAGSGALATLLGFGTLLPMAAVALWRLPRSPAGFAAATALLALVFFSFGRQAFANYYLVVTAALCCAVAAATAEHAPTPDAPAAAATASSR